VEGKKAQNDVLKRAAENPKLKTGLLVEEFAARTDDPSFRTRTITMKALEKQIQRTKAKALHKPKAPRTFDDLEEIPEEFKVKEIYARFHQVFFRNLPRFGENFYMHIVLLQLTVQEDRFLLFNLALGQPLLPGPFLDDDDDAGSESSQSSVASDVAGPSKAKKKKLAAKQVTCRVCRYPHIWSRLIYFRPIFGVKIGVASWVRRGRRPRPAAGRPNPTWQPRF
jgi:hypothetical protein